jgi:glycerol-3-phosphate dehydrogenase
VRFAVRHEMARTVEDVLARRSRLLFLDASRAHDLARPVAVLLHQELGRAVPQGEVLAFEALARRYQGLADTH